MPIAPYGSWTSPISAADLARSEHPAGGGQFVGDELWWHELRPTEGGRYAIRRAGADGEPVDVLPAPWNARTRVHEYGGGAWTATPGGALVFAEFTDQRLYRLDPGASEPVPLTPEPERPTGLRYAELSVAADGAEIWCIRESHAADATIVRDLCAVPLDGSAAHDGSLVRSLAGGSDFLAFPRLSPDGRRLAWIAWNHPQMPWDGTELKVAELDSDGRAGTVVTVAGSATESLLQPEWADADSLFVLSDRSGWWNLYQVEASTGAELRPVSPLSRDLGGPLWGLGSRWYGRLDDTRLLAVSTLGQDELAVIDIGTGAYTPVDLGDLSTLRLGAVRGDRVLLGSAGSRSASGVRLLDLADGSVQVVRLSVDELPPEAYLPVAQGMSFTGESGRDVHAFVYPPANPEFQAPDGELPPYLALVHGGPTAHVSPSLDLSAAYFTSRGIGIIDVNYGGSTGYGREYRERLRGQWGVVDVEDSVAAVQGLAAAGLADGSRLAIQGGSAGGWTVLAALTGTDVFACGASYFGVAELVEFAQNTHDFESRYLDGLIGPLPEAAELYTSRAPVNHVDSLSCPVLLLQGLDDPVVPPQQAELFRDAMVARGIRHAYLAYEGESHGFRRTETLISSREAELSFYGQVLGFETPGVPPLELWEPGGSGGMSPSHD